MKNSFRKGEVPFSFPLYSLFLPDLVVHFSIARFSVEKCLFPKYHYILKSTLDTLLDW